MEITSFALGMLTMIAIMIIVSVVVGLVGVYRLNGSLKSTINELQIINENTHRRIDDEVRKIETQMKSVEEHINDVSIENDKQISDLYSYIDSRFDKLMNNLNK
jgi:predicted PurR-regulated permease PerM